MTVFSIPSKFVCSSIAPMRTHLAVALLAAGLQTGQTAQPIKEASSMKITPLIYAPEVEPALKLWVDRLHQSRPSAGR
jgi:hypothetical protein